MVRKRAPRAPISLREKVAEVVDAVPSTVVDADAAFSPPAVKPAAADPELGAKRQDLVERRRGRPPKKDQWAKAGEAADDRLPPDEVVEKWRPVGDMLAVLTSGMYALALGEDEALNATELDMMANAWATYLTVEPPTDIATIIKLNLVGVYVITLGPRLFRKVWPRVRKWLDRRAAQREAKYTDADRRRRGKEQEDGRSDHEKDAPGAAGSPLP